MKILLVEDFKLTRKIEIDLLNKLGFTDIVEADGVDSAIEKIKQEPDIRLILSDWNMPGKSGYDLLVWVRSQEKYRDIPFVMVTARAGKVDLKKAEKAGVANFITKPFTVIELKRVISETLGEEPGPVEIIKRTGTVNGKVRLNVGHIQITDHLILGVLKHLIRTRQLRPRHFALETHCMSGWNPVQKALEKGDVDAAFILAPIALDLINYDVPAKIVLLAHKNGSICVKNRIGTPGESFREFFIGKSFYIPHTLSVHHMLSHMFFHELGLNPGMMGDKNADVIFEVIPPVSMPDLMGKSAEVSGLMVAQPVGAKAISDGGAELIFLSGELWEHHPCCVVAIRDGFVEKHTDAVYEFVDMLVQAGQFVGQNPEKSAWIAADFLDPETKLNLSVPVLENVLMEPHGLKTDDLFPVIEDFEKMQRYMHEKMGINIMADLAKAIDLRFAKAACAKVFTPSHPSVFNDPSDIVWKIYKRQRQTG